ncbi:hypothetical protein TARUN_224 [Trichoderma arundinaceum]|uniref:Uncharacterized protein n=1 Tax=Trichoderma arundinaceum TaxID=490622 RepID=A0A395P0Y7_TRIAR|nr:hypothetical protein TARUN_224 [Trichoderma arundinaceum]
MARFAQQAFESGTTQPNQPASLFLSLQDAQLVSARSPVASPRPRRPPLFFFRTRCPTAGLTVVTLRSALALATKRPAKPLLTSWNRHLFSSAKASPSMARSSATPTRRCGFKRRPSFSGRSGRSHTHSAFGASACAHKDETGQDRTRPDRGAHTPLFALPRFR